MEKAEEAFSEFNAPDQEEKHKQEQEEINHVFNIIVAQVSEFVKKNPGKGKEVGIDKLFKASMKITLRNLEKDGFKLSTEQKQALTELLESFKQQIKPSRAKKDKVPQKPETASKINNTIESKMKRLKEKAGDLTNPIKALSYSVDLEDLLTSNEEKNYPIRKEVIRMSLIGIKNRGGFDRPGTSILTVNSDVMPIVITETQVKVEFRGKMFIYNIEDLDK
jgi:flagellin-specific chaperone FliS